MHFSISWHAFSFKFDFIKKISVDLVSQMPKEEDEEVGASWVFGLFIFSISRGFPTKLSKCIDVVVVFVLKCR